ncbi:DUF2213 domain-containing protein [Sandarakinorhabdus sp. DWP1-3-1]|uniref:DUF2213 domain-containing protein n=1 Tax=Sandarakinorhabdus sp. DWP1-3-1 TaxID=2804627 RepID=UPI003CFB330D
MQIQLSDTAPLTGIRITRDGYLVGEARIARTGIQQYTAGELGLTDRAPGEFLRVYRPADEVFATDAMASMAHRPITLDHPPVMVTADNWSQYAKGDTGGEVMRDGEFVKVPIKIMDGATIRAIQSGKRELSVGYTCDLVVEAGVTDSGEAYDAWQRTPRGNHVAVCSVARGGSDLRIGDTGESKVATKTITFDGLPIETTDAAEAVINKLAGQVAALNAKVADAAAKEGAALAAVATKDGEIVALKSQLADANDPAKIAARDAARQAVIADAKKIAPTLVVDGKSDAEIRRAAVAVRLGDAATALDDAGIAGAFAAFATTTADAKTDPLRTVIGDGVVSIGDAQKARDAALAARAARFATAHAGAATA